jgi:hypothetical protein
MLAMRTARRTISERPGREAGRCGQGVGGLQAIASKLRERCKQLTNVRDYASAVCKYKK